MSTDQKLPPLVTPGMVKGVSQFRRDLLEQQVSAGLFRDGTSNDSHFLTGGTNKSGGAGNIVAVRKKTASFGQPDAHHNGSTSAGWSGTGGTVRQTTEVYSPLWLTSNLNLPRDLGTLNAWARAFFALNPIVQNAISLHSTYPISKLNIKCEDPVIAKFFEDMADKLDLLNVCIQIAQEYWVLGEAFPYANYDEANGVWDHILLQNPDTITVQRSMVAGESLISLRPDANLVRICTGNRPADLEQRKRLNEDVIRHVKRHENIPLSSFNISHLARRIAPYESRGTSLIVSCFRSLMLWDKIRESNFAAADDLINPLTLIKVGGGADNYKPMPADMEKWREVFEDLTYDKNKKLITHDGVTVESVGLGAGIYDTSNIYEQLKKEIYIGLMAPSVILDGGGDITYANGGVALDVLRQRYMSFREMLSKWLRLKIFAPISRAQGFVKHEGGKEILIVPEVEWNHMSVFDVETYINSLKELATSEKPIVSQQTLFRSLGLDYEDEQRKLRKELVDSVIIAKERSVLETMNLADLRGITDTEEINETEESKEAPLPGEGTEGGMDLGLPGMEGMDQMGGGLPEPPAPPPPTE